VIQHVPDLAPHIDRVRGKFTRATDAAAVTAAEALGHAYAGDPGTAARLLDGALTTAAQSGCGFYATAAYFMKCLCAAPMENREALWGRAFAHVAASEPDKAERVLSEIFSKMSVSDVKLAAGALESTRLPREVADHGLELLAEFVAKNGLDSSLIPIELATDPDTISRRVRQAARLLVRTGLHAEAMELARLAGFQAGERPATRTNLGASGYLSVR
jgi:hypothetical protein